MMTISSSLFQCKMHTSLLCIKPHPFFPNSHNHLFSKPAGKHFSFRFLKQESVINSGGKNNRGRMNTCNVSLLPIDPWSPNVDSQSIASQLFAFSLFPYIGFLYFITKSKTSPKLTLFGFYFLLVFVGATIPAGIYAKLKYGTSLSNVDWLHGGAESLLTLTNLFIVLGLRQSLRNNPNDSEGRTSDSAPALEEEKNS